MHSETLRQLAHLSGLAFVAAAQYLDWLTAAAMFFAIGAFFFFYAEYVKRTKPALGFRNFVFKFEKRKGRNFSGAFWFYIGAGLGFILFPLNIASAAAAILAVGDSFSTLIGVHFGKHKIVGKKSLEGSLAFLFGSFLISLVFVKPVIGLIGSVIAMLVELFTPHKTNLKNYHWVFDDNLLIPIISGIVMLALGFFIYP